MTQFYQLTLKDALTQYQAGFLSSAGLLFNYLKIKFAPGWKMQIEQQKVCQELGLSRDQFYRGLKLIKQHFPNLKLYRTTALVGEFEREGRTGNPCMTNRVVETQNNTTVNEPVVPATNPVVEAANSSVDSTKPVAPTANRVVETATNAPLKPPKNKADSDSPDSSSNSYQSFLNSLSQSQRESFLKFCEQQASLLPKPPVSLKKWIQNNWSELVANWQKKFRDVAQLESNNTQKDWRNHPKFEEWLGYVRINYGGFCHTDTLDCRDVNGKGEVYVFGTPEDRAERRAFAAWARANKLF
jgi:hypothetical protein